MVHKYRAVYDSVFGKVLISSDGEGITEVKLGNFSETEIQNSPDRLTDIAAAQLSEYFARKRESFDVPLCPAGTAFQRLVWEKLCAVPYGETRSYKQIAESVGNPKSCRAVGMANNRNPIMVIIPCHRIIGTNGSLTGYAAGLPVKQRLLDLERAL